MLETSNHRLRKIILTNGNSWVHLTNSNTVVIFIHGLISNSVACWTNPNKAFWPRLLATDQSFGNAATFVASYETTPSSGSYDIDQSASAVLDELRVRPPGDRSPLTFENIIFIGHSLGGVVARRMLEQYREYFSGKNIGLVLIASPSLGSLYPKAFSRIISLYGHKTASQLSTNSETLRDLDNRFRNLLQKHPFKSFTGAEACEHHGLLWSKYFPIRMSPIVGESSASRYFGGLKIIPGSTHISISKPDSVEHPSHKFLRVYFHDNFYKLIRTDPIKSDNDKSSSEQREPDPLFDLYSARHSAVYLERQADEDLSQAMKTGSAWLYGPSGTGKTTLAKRWICENGLSPVEITLSQMGDNTDNDRLFQEVAQHLEAKGLNVGNGGLPGCVDAITELCKSTTIPIFVDEVPMGNPGADKTLPSAISSILDGVKRKSGSEAKIIVCSIVKPSDDPNSGKLREQFSMLPQKKWEESEIEALVSIIQEKMKIAIPEASIKKIVASCEASPRFIKIFFKRAYGKTSLTDEQVSNGLRETLHIIRGLV